MSSAKHTTWREGGYRYAGAGRLGHQRGVVDGRPVVRFWSRRHGGCWCYHVISESEMVAGLWTVERRGTPPPPPIPDWS